MRLVGQLLGSGLLVVVVLQAASAIRGAWVDGVAGEGWLVPYVRLFYGVVGLRCLGLLVETWRVQ